MGGLLCLRIQYDEEIEKRELCDENGDIATCAGNTSPRPLFGRPWSHLMAGLAHLRFLKNIKPSFWKIWDRFQSSSRFIARASLTPGPHTVQAASTQPFENGASFRLYVLNRWENNSTLTLRTIDIEEGANHTLTTYYNRLTIISFSRLKLGTHFVAGCTFWGEDTS
jgi:hypothetical protein